MATPAQDLRTASINPVEAVADRDESAERFARANEIATRFVANIESVVYGKREEVKLVLTALVCGGHVLLEDVPGTAKTVLAPEPQIACSSEGRGDLWRVTLTVDADNDMSGVALTDHIPAGARIMGDGDGRDSAIASLGENRESRGMWPTHVERSFSAFRAYYAVLPKGRFTIDYTLRLNNAGNFALPPTRVEAMYAPDVFGEVPNGRVTVGE